MKTDYRQATPPPKTRNFYFKFTMPIDKTENVKFYTQKCGFKIVSTEKDGSVELARFVLER